MADHIRAYERQSVIEEFLGIGNVLDFYKKDESSDEKLGSELIYTEDEYKLIKQAVYEHFQDQVDLLLFSSVKDSLSEFCSKIGIHFELVSFLEEKGLIKFKHEPFSFERYLTRGTYYKIKKDLEYLAKTSEHTSFIKLELEGISSMDSWLWLNRIFKGGHKGFPLNNVMYVTQTELTTLEYLVSEYRNVNEDFKVFPMIKDVPNGDFYRLENGSVWVRKAIVDFFEEEVKPNVVKDFSSEAQRVTLREACTYLTSVGIRRYDLERSVFSGVLTAGSDGKFLVGDAVKIKDLYKKGYNLTESIAIATGLIKERDLDTHKVFTKNVLNKVLSKTKGISSNKVSKIINDADLGFQIGTSHTRLYRVQNVRDYLKQIVRDVAIREDFIDVYNVNSILDVLKNTKLKLTKDDARVLSSLGFNSNLGRWVFTVYGSNVHVDSGNHLYIYADDLPEKVREVLDLKYNKEFEVLHSNFKASLMNYVKWEGSK